MREANGRLSRSFASLILKNDLSSNNLQIGRDQPVDTQGKGNFAAVVQIVLDDVPDDPLACQATYLAIARFLEDVIEVSGRPAGERGLEHMPGDFEAVDQFCGASGGRAFFIPGLQGQDNPCVAFAHAHVKPADTGADNMGHVFANAAQMGSWPQSELLSRKRSNGGDEKLLVLLPALVKREQVGMLFSHEG